MLVMKIVASIVGVISFGACADVATYQVELTLEAGQSVVDLGGNNKVYTGPGIFQFEQRGPRIDEIEGFRFGVYGANRIPSNEHSFRPSDCKARCIGLMACDPNDIRLELQRWKLLPSGIDPWKLDIGFCTLSDGSQSFFGVD
jgi:hypothetical protein